MKRSHIVSRRSFLAGMGAVSALALAACSQGGTDSESATTASVAKPFDKLVEVDGNFAYNAADDGLELHHS